MRIMQKKARITLFGGESKASALDSKGATDAEPKACTIERPKAGPRACKSKPKFPTCLGNELRFGLRKCNPKCSSKTRSELRFTLRIMHNKARMSLFGGVSKAGALASKGAPDAEPKASALDKPKAGPRA